MMAKNATNRPMKLRTGASWASLAALRATRSSSCSEGSTDASGWSTTSSSEASSKIATGVGGCISSSCTFAVAPWDSALSAIVSSGTEPKPTAKRNNNANAAAFEAMLRNALTSAHAPWNTSGAQKWNGTTDNLKATPTAIIIALKQRTACSDADIFGKISANCKAIVGKCAELVKPDNSEIP